jgi:hypothetical protein
MYRLKDDGNKKLYQVHRLACKGCPNSGSLCKAKRPTITRPLDTEALMAATAHNILKIARRLMKAAEAKASTVSSLVDAHCRSYLGLTLMAA